MCRLATKAPEKNESKKTWKWAFWLTDNHACTRL